ncbi:MAG TPA: ribosome silencing factor [Acidobacteriota bacterium]|nr:ribosome silencing factor [Acidobacteriota bacterium]
MKDALKIALKAVDDKKASDLVVLDISGIASFADYFLLCSGDSSRQIQAIADEVEEKLRCQGLRATHIEGYRNAEWILMDYIDLVVHIFSKKARAYYDLERLWRDGKRLDAEKLLAERGTKAAPVKSPRTQRRGTTHPR